MKRCVSFDAPPCCGGWDRTTDLQVMSLTSYHCSTPRYIIHHATCHLLLISSSTFGNTSALFDSLLDESECKGTTLF